MSQKVWRGLFLSLILSAALLMSACSSSAGGPVATVNGENISRDDFNKKLEETAGKQVLDRLIQEKLIEQEAKKQSITVTDKDLDAKIAEIKSSFGTEQQFQDALTQNSLTLEKLKEQLKSQIIVEKASRKGISVTESEMRAHYDQNKDSMYTGKEYEDVKKDAEAYLVNQKAQQKAAAWVQGLQTKAKIVNKLYPEKAATTTTQQPDQNSTSQPSQ